MDRPLVALVLAGGTGTRLYPASRSHRPKQFLDFGGEDSLLTRTVERLKFVDETFVVAGDEHASLVREHAPETDILIEPKAMDTGPALVYATHRIREEVGDCTILAVPSDHFIAGEFEPIARKGAAAAVETKGIITFGIEPTRPATGYGYIEPEHDHGGYFSVAQFREKPDSETAERFVDDGFYWNAGMFTWTTETFLREAQKSPLAPLVDALDGGGPARGFAAVDPISVDYAILERTDDAYVVPATFEWDDLGSWDALARVADAGEDGNVKLTDATTIDSSGNVIAGDAHVSVVGISNLVVVAVDDRVLVVPKEDAQRIRELVAVLRDDGQF